LIKPDNAHQNIMPNTLTDWLAYIERLHPKAIAMGLDRANQLVDYLALKPTFKIITVGGTNGKGSTSAMLAHIYKEAGYHVGCYTSPHLIDYNERVTVNLSPATDAALCAAFSHIELARQALNLELTYFEVGTLAAIWHFIQANIDVAVLEVGLGGRLDTVNVFDADCAIITSVDLDHQEFLGHTREAIATEKSAIFRPNRPAICGDAIPPQSLINYANTIQAQLLCIHQDFSCTQSSELALSMDYQFGAIQYSLPIPKLFGAYQLSNAGCAITAVNTLLSVLPVTVEVIASAMQKVSLAGRFQTIQETPTIILDVAHNPHAAQALADNLRSIADENSKIIAVFAMLQDKDIEGVINVIAPLIHAWYIAGIDHPRGAKADILEAHVLKLNPNSQTHTFASVIAAYQAACAFAEKYMFDDENVKIIVFGSFFTVANILQLQRDRIPVFK
jgi:dihydrofolate synthase / folylpolyglutamate synthase